MAEVKVVIVPGNGAGDVEAANWYAAVRDQLNHSSRIQATLGNMPDPLYARESVWLPFMQDKLKCDDNTIIIGHSSGAAAALRFCETHSVRGIILVGAYISDLDDDIERKSGYFNRPWKWDVIKQNAGFIAQFGSTDDPFLPWDEQNQVAVNLDADLKKYTNRGHFCSMAFPELVDYVKSKI